MSNIAFVALGETWPEAARLPLGVHELNDEPAHIFGMDGHSEVILLGLRTEAGGDQLVIPLRFPTLERGTRAGKILADAFASVRAIQEEPEPDQSACSHERTDWIFLDRQGTKYPVCPDCGRVGRPLQIHEWRDRSKEGTLAADMG